jgi:hypothetical protein
VDRALEMTARFASAADAPASSAAKHGGSLPARQAKAATKEWRSRPAPCSRRSGSNRQGRQDGRDWPYVPARCWTRHVSGRMRNAAAVQDRRRACGRRKRPSAAPAQTEPAARLIEFSIGTSSSIRAAVPARAPLDPRPAKTARRHPIHPAKLRRFFDRYFTAMRSRRAAPSDRRGRKGRGWTNEILRLRRSNRDGSGHLGAPPRADHCRCNVIILHFDRLARSARGEA